MILIIVRAFFYTNFNIAVRIHTLISVSCSAFASDAQIWFVGILKKNCFTFFMVLAHIRWNGGSFKKQQLAVLKLKVNNAYTSWNKIEMLKWINVAVKTVWYNSKKENDGQFQLTLTHTPCCGDANFPCSLTSKFISLDLTWTTTNIKWEKETKCLSHIISQFQAYTIKWFLQNVHRTFGIFLLFKPPLVIARFIWIKAFASSTDSLIALQKSHLSTSGGSIL